MNHRARVCLAPIPPLAASWAGVFFFLACAGCTSVPSAPVPPPLPEYLVERSQAPNALNSGAFLGIHGSENDSGSLDDFFSDPGVRVDTVIENSPAAEAGIRPGDVLLRFENEVLEDPRSLDALVRAGTPGTQVQLEFRRGDAVLVSTVTLVESRGSSPAPEPQYLLENRRLRAGFMTGKGGVRLVSVANNSPLRRAGIEPGTLITSLDGKDLLSDRQLIRRLGTYDAGQSVTLTVQNADGQERTVTVALLSAPSRITKAGVPILFNYTSSLDGREQSFSLLDLWIFQLIHYQRDGSEKTWVMFELFGFDLISFGTGQGELE
jgi:membrane-associated protease RseP (regulator of RpoE activity)